MAVAGRCCSRATRSPTTSRWPPPLAPPAPDEMPSLADGAGRHAAAELDVGWLVVAVVLPSAPARCRRLRLRQPTGDVPTVKCPIPDLDGLTPERLGRRPDQGLGRSSVKRPQGRHRSGDGDRRPIPPPAPRCATASRSPSPCPRARRSRTVPTDLAGQPVADAQAALAKLGLSRCTTEDYDEEVARRCHPEAGRRHRRYACRRARRSAWSCRRARSRGPSPTTWSARRPSRRSPSSRRCSCGRRSRSAGSHDDIPAGRGHAASSPAPGRTVPAGRRRCCSWCREVAAR